MALKDGIVHWIITLGNIIHRYCTVRLMGLAGFAYKFVVSAEHLSARSAALWQAASPLINFAASEAG